MQVDHFEPIYRGYTEKELDRGKIKRGALSIENLMPSCARCNKWKATFKIETFRNEISLQFERLLRDSNQFRMAFDFGIVKKGELNFKFWFEKYLDDVH